MGDRARINRQPERRKPYSSTKVRATGRDDAEPLVNLKGNREGKRSWQSQKQLLVNLDIHDLQDYLLDDNE